MPDVRYARSGDLAIAYQVVGDGPIDLVFVPLFSNLVWHWQHSIPSRFFTELASFTRLILFDKRGLGLSDRPRDLPTLETRMDDIRAVLDDVGSERAAMLGMYEGSAICTLFAATYPERVEALILVGPGTRTSPGDRAGSLRKIQEEWGRWEHEAPHVAPEMEQDYREWWVNLMRLAASPQTAAAYMRMAQGADTTEILPAVHAPTLVFYRELGDGAWRHAQAIEGAVAVKIPRYSSPWLIEELLSETRGFLDSHDYEPLLDRVLATVLFTDIVDSTRRAADSGDREWRALLEAHHRVVRREISRFRGRELDTTGDGFFAAFDGPARAIQCARAVVHSVRELGLQIRAGVHTGECEIFGSALAGIAVNIGARVASEAGAGEIWVSSTVRDLVAGSGLEFEERGEHELKGVPGSWRLFSVVPSEE